MTNRSMLTAGWFGRALTALGLAAALLSTPFGSSSPARAEHAPDHDPAARLELVIRRIIIHDISEPWYESEGEFTFKVTVWEDRAACPRDLQHCRDETDIVRTADIKFDAHDDQTVTLDRVVPGPGDWAADASIGPGIGIPLYAGPSYRWEIKGWDRDPGFDDELGSLRVRFDQETDWSLGIQTQRGFGCQGDGVTSPRQCGYPALFSVEWEIRRAALPDLRPTDIRVFTETGEACLVARNDGPQDSGPFRMRLYLDDALAPGGDVGPITLAAGETNGVCKAIPLPTGGSHRLALVVDEERAVPETVEGNNRREEAYPGPLARPGIQDRPGITSSDPIITPDPGGCDPIEGTGCPSGPTGPIRPVIPAGPLPVLSQATGPDLRLGAVEVRARDGGRCVIRGDRNTVSATIANAGDQDAGQFSVEVTVGGERRGLATVGSLAGGAERKVEIRDVGIAEGERSLRVTADSANAVAEQDEANNAGTVEVDCTRR